ncbi:MAG: (d)CMP kinase [Pseudomonadota bacterium]
MSFVVAIDGPAAAGKGTIARAVAEHFGLAHLDTGLLYRAVGRRALAEAGPSLEPETVAEAVAQALTPADIERDDLRTATVAMAASRVAALPEVRAALLAFQRDFAARDGGAVLDGRDIGTVICPDASVKLFVTASDRCRAERRYAELKDRGEETAFETVLKDVRDRDARDAERATAPMAAARDAVTIDTSDMSVTAAVAAAIATVDAARGQGSA